MLQDICTKGKPQAEYLLQRNQGSIVFELCDLILQKKSPKALADKSGETRVEMGGSASRAAFGPLVAIICHIIRCMHTESTNEVTKTFKTFEVPLESEKPHE